MEFLNFIGCINKGFEIWYAPANIDTPYVVREVTLLDDRQVATFSIYDDAMDYLKLNTGEANE